MIHTESYELAKSYNQVKSRLKQQFLDYGKSNNFPIIQEDTLQFLLWFSQMVKPKHILELGTGYGFMAYHLLETNAEMNLTGIDYTQENYNTFLSFSPENQIVQRYRFIEANALYWIQNETNFYDWIIIDCDKKYYPSLIEPCLRRLACGGFLIADNVLWKGMVAEEEKKSKVLPILEFNQKIANDNRLQSVIVPIGDGLSLSLKKIR